LFILVFLICIFILVNKHIFIEFIVATHKSIIYDASQHYMNLSGEMNMNAQFEKIAEPIKEINNLTVKNFETVIGMQLKNAEENAKIGVEQAKSAASINDADSLKGYLSAQAEITQQYNDRLVESAKSFVELGNAYSNEIQRIVKDTFTV
jgi:phasin family protein